jgi:hypothetical protein
MAPIMLFLAAAIVVTVLLRVIIALLTISAGVAAAIILYPMVGATPYAGMAVAALITFAVGVSVRKLQYSMG